MKKPENYIEWLIVSAALFAGFDFGMLFAGGPWISVVSGVTMLVVMYANVINNRSYKRNQVELELWRKNLVMRITVPDDQAEEVQRKWKEHFGVHESER
jgi:polyferredoxin